MDITRRRLYNQQISRHSFSTPAQVVAWLGGVQAQDYGAAKWAVGQRLRDATDAGVERAFTEGAILRTHVLRPTWHFVAPADIRWMLALTAPRVNAASAYWYRRLELDDALFRQSNAALAKALEGGKHLTRQELVSALATAGITTDVPLRSVYIIGRAELDAVICSGPRLGKQFTYALLDERVPPTQPLPHDEALARLAACYFAGRGPATLHDFVWWSGLATADAKAGIEMVKSQFVEEVVGGQTYWFSASEPPAEDTTPSAYLLPNYDEYVVGYKDRSATFDEAHSGHLDARGNVLFEYTIIIDGRVRGTWKRTLKKDVVVVEPNLFSPLTADEAQALNAAIERYGRFIGLPPALQTKPR